MRISVISLSLELLHAPCSSLTNLPPLLETQGILGLHFICETKCTGWMDGWQADQIEQNLVLVSSFLTDIQAAQNNFSLSFDRFPYLMLLKYNWQYWETLS